jgi:hypothetical protein
MAGQFNDEAGGEAFGEGDGDVDEVRGATEGGEVLGFEFLV